MIGVSYSVMVAHYIDQGIARFKANQFHEAIAAFDAALQIDPSDRYARWNRATALLSLGDYQRGFPEHDVAWRLFHWRGFGPIKNHIDRLEPLPLWRGETGGRLLLYHELGYGDAIMVLRYLPEIKRRTEAVLVIEQPLVRLARNFGIEVTDQLPDDLSGFDYRLPLFAVMSALAATADNIPTAPYIATAWHREPGHIGIAWSGRTQTALSLDDFLARLAHQGRQLYALQPATVTGPVEPFPAWCNFADLADRIAMMEHVVSVDTAAIHLAGAMGHPSAHLVLPFTSDWRWWHVERWYPTVRTYRQHDPLDWITPFARINAALAS